MQLIRWNPSRDVFNLRNRFTGVFDRAVEDLVLSQLLVPPDSRGFAPEHGQPNGEHVMELTHPAPLSRHQRLVVQVGVADQNVIIVTGCRFHHFPKRVISSHQNVARSDGESRSLKTVV